MQFVPTEGFLGMNGTDDRTATACASFQMHISMEPELKLCACLLCIHVKRCTQARVSTWLDNIPSEVNIQIVCDLGNLSPHGDPFMTSLGTLDLLCGEMVPTQNVPFCSMPFTRGTDV